MMVPVLHSFKITFPSVRLSVLTKSTFAGVFKGLDVDLIIADTNGRHKGLPGLIRLFREMRSNYKFDAVADLHNVLRSRILRLLFSISAVKIASIDKERDKLKKLTRKKDKVLKPLPDRFERYKKVLNELGFDFTLNFKSIFPQPQQLNNAILNLTGGKQKYWIGVAPFAAFQPKIYPFEKMKEVIRLLMIDPSNKIMFFGGGKNETITLDQWQKEFPGCINISGKLSLEDELLLMSHLNVMVAMDSANMHFASLTGIPVVSIWGATHPFAGFTPWGQPASNQVQIDLFCRPCSVYGNVPCYRGDHACMRDLPALIIAEKVNEFLGNNEV